MKKYSELRKIKNTSKDSASNRSSSTSAKKSKPTNLRKLKDRYTTTYSSTFINTSSYSTVSRKNNTKIISPVLPPTHSFKDPSGSAFKRKLSENRTYMRKHRSRVTSQEILFSSIKTDQSNCKFSNKCNLLVLV